MIARLPVIPTILVLIAVGVMIRLGLWQIDRMEEKEAMLARYAAISADAPPVAWPGNDDDTASQALFRRTSVDCVKVQSVSSMAGKNAAGEAGLGVTAQCVLPDGSEAMVVLGWSRAPVVPDWTGGKVSGVIGQGPRLIADPPRAGLERNAAPDPRAIPNNHWSYAIQWFLFAIVALVVYALALRHRLVADRQPS